MTYPLHSTKSAEALASAPRDDAGWGGAADPAVAAIEEYCGMPFLEAVEKYCGPPILCDGGHYVSIATPPGCGREHFAAMAKVYQSLLRPDAPRAVQQDHARKVAEARAALRLDKPPRQRRPRIAPSDGLRTKAEAATKLGCSIKTLNGHVATGALKYIAVGHGKKRQRRMFTDAVLDEFIANQTRKDVPCPSIAIRARRSGTSISGGEVIGFTARRNARRDAKPKK